jgi:hypothetical protein
MNERDLELTLLKRLSLLFMSHENDHDLIAERNNITVRHAQCIVSATVRELREEARHERPLP